MIWGEIVTEPKSIRPMHSEAKQYENISVWSREEFTAEPWVALALKKLQNFLKAVHKAIL